MSESSFDNASNLYMNFGAGDAFSDTIIDSAAIDNDTPVGTPPLVDGMRSGLESTFAKVKAAGVSAIVTGLVANFIPADSKAQPVDIVPYGNNDSTPAHIATSVKKCETQALSRPKNLKMEFTDKRRVVNFLTFSIGALKSCKGKRKVEYTEEIKKSPDSPYEIIEEPGRFTTNKSRKIKYLYYLPFNARKCGHHGFDANKVLLRPYVKETYLSSGSNTTKTHYGKAYNVCRNR